MRVMAVFHATLRRYGGGTERVETQLPDGVDIAALCQRFDMVPGVTELVLLNGRFAAIHDVLHDGDVVEFYPVCGGG